MRIFFVSAGTTRAAARPAQPALFAFLAGPRPVMGVAGGHSSYHPGARDRHHGECPNQQPAGRGL